MTADNLPIQEANGKWNVTLPDGRTLIVDNENDAKTISSLSSLQDRVLQAEHSSDTLLGDLAAAIVTCRRYGLDLDHLEGLVRETESLPRSTDPDWQE